VQRCYYQPVTSYQSRSYYEPVTTYQTSYYYEPVTSYRYSCYYDPCTCSYQQVACPVTSYRLRSQCNAVQSYVQRCSLVPVTTYQQVSYYEPVTSCYTPCVPTSAPVAVPQVPVQTAPPPGVSEQRQPAPSPGVQEYQNRPGTGGVQSERYYPVPDPMPPASGSSFRQAPVPRQGTPPAPPPPTVRLDRIVSTSARVEGQLVRMNNAPLPGVRVLFVRADRQASTEESVTADARGQFRVSLASGGWLVYMPDADGKLKLHSKLDVRANETRQVTLVSR
jgi:hypothetical protein